MNKPYTLRVNDFTNDILNVINNHNVDAYAMITELSKIINMIMQQDGEEIERYNNTKEEDTDVQDK